MASYTEFTKFHYTPRDYEIILNELKKKKQAALKRNRWNIRINKIRKIFNK